MLVINANPATFSNVGHVQRDDDRPAQLKNLMSEEQVAAQVGRVSDDQYGIRFVQVINQTEHQIAGHHFIRRLGGQRIGAGQIDQTHRSGRKGDGSRVVFNGHAGKVRRFLTQPRQGVKQRALTGVGISDDGNDRQR